MSWILLNDGINVKTPGMPIPPLPWEVIMKGTLSFVPLPRTVGHRQSSSDKANLPCLNTGRSRICIESI
jgi:hypothetical protein